MERQAALRAAQTSSSQDPIQREGVTEELIRKIQQVREEEDLSLGRITGALILK